MTTPQVRVRSVSKTYLRHRHTTVKDALVGGWRRSRSERTMALRDVSFDVASGRAVGLIGHNGAGKSTLLRLLGGVGRPDSGEIQVRGSISGLFELGTGMHPELTGRESVLVTGVLAGLTRPQVRARLSDIVEFAEITEVIDQPTRTYSTGMRARLAFATAVHVDADVLLVDEVLAVGDLAFQARCLDRIQQLQRSGVTSVVVSHDPSMIDLLCDEVVWLQGGRLIGQGDPREITQQYRAAMEEETRRITPRDAPEAVTPAGRPLRVLENRFGSLDAVIEAVTVTDAWGAVTERISPGAALRVHVHVRLPQRSEPAVQVNAALVRHDGVVCVETSTACVATSSHLRASLSIDRLDLAPGRYAWNVGVHSSDWSRTLDFHWLAYPLEMDGVASPSAPVMAPSMSWSTTDVPSGTEPANAPS